MHRFVVVMVSVALAACSDSAQPTGGSTPEGGTAPTGAGPAGGAGEGGIAQGGESAGGSVAGGSGGESSGGAPPTFDCATAPTTPVSQAELVGLHGYHGLAVSADGMLFGLDTGFTLGRGPHDGPWQPYVQNLTVNQMEFGQDGRLFLASGSGLVAIGADALPFMLNVDVAGLYGLRVGPDDQIYVADPTGVRRIDPVSGVGQTVVSVPGSSAHSFDFSPSLDKLYIGTVGQGILQVALDANHVASGPLESFADLGIYSWVDGVATDACGTVYAVDFNTKQLLRIPEGGEVEVYLQWKDSEYGHGLIFGNGVGGFREDALYLPLPYNGNSVLEVVVGVPSRSADVVVVDGP